MRLIIAGSRTFTDYNFVKTEINKILSRYTEEGYPVHVECIVSGCANGVDRLGERYATEHNIKLVYFPADWKVMGRAAGPIRNIEMSNYGDALIAFWDGESMGTKHMIEAMQERNKELHVISIKK